MTIIISVLIVLIVTAGVITAQVFLSRAESKIPGLLLPILFFVFSILYCLCIAVPPGADGVNTAVILVIFTFLLTNIITVILLLIYYFVRRQMNRKKQVEKMQIQDL